jgi:uncharacterized protein YfaS (alpha-2-macroglobulin family)
LLSLESAQPQPVKLAPGARSTLFIPVSALAGYGDGEVNARSRATFRVKPSHRSRNSWKIGVRPAFPAQTVNTAPC